MLNCGVSGHLTAITTVKCDPTSESPTNRGSECVSMSERWRMDGQDNIFLEGREK